MTTVFKTTVRPIFLLGQIIGMINISYTLKPNGVLMRSSNSSYYSLLELSRMSVLIICSYYVHVRGVYYVQQFRLVKFWVIIITARVSEIWTIKLINRIMEYDQKHAIFSPALLAHKRSPSKTCWNIVAASLIVYLTGYECLAFYLWRPNLIDYTTVLIYFFNLPYITDFVVLFTVTFYLSNIGCRFLALNNFWRCLPAGLVPVSGQWSHSEIMFLTENIRLLHADLTEVLKIFNLGFGPLLLCYFVCSYIDLLYVFYLMLYHEFKLPKLSVIEKMIKYLPLHIFNVQIILFMIFIIVAASWINEKKMEIISYLRLYKISSLPVDIKIQVKMFMNQISISQLDEVTAFGFFSVNLNLVVTIIALVMTSLSTLIQLKNHPIIIAMINNTNSFHKVWVRKSYEIKNVNHYQLTF